MPSVTPIPPRLPDEPIQWYRRFCAWLRLPAPRSVLAIYLAEWEKRLAKRGLKKPDKTPVGTPGSWEGKPQQFKWRERGAQWDLAEVERLNVELALARDEWRAQERAAAQALLDKGLEAIQSPLVNTRLPDGREIRGDPATVRAGADCVAKASDLARRALEMATSTTRINVSQMSDAEIIRLLDLAERGGLAGGGGAEEAEADEPASTSAAPTPTADAA